MINKNKLNQLKQEFVMNRQQKLEFLSCYLNYQELYGLELGPDIHPIVQATEDTKIDFIEVDDTASIKERARRAGHDASKVPDITYKFDFQKGLAGTIGESGKYDYVLSSHMIEHTVDFIRHLQDVAYILNSQGVYGIIAPDQKLIFDFNRHTSTLGDVIETYAQKHSNPSIAKYVDSVRYRVFADETGKGWWNRDSNSSLSLTHPNWNSILQEFSGAGFKVPSKWFDHSWVFTCDSFVDLIFDLKQIGLLEFDLVDIHPTGHMDFIVILAKKDSKLPKITRDEAMILLEKQGYIKQSSPFTGLHELR